MSEELTWNLCLFLLGRKKSTKFQTKYSHRASSVLWYKVFRTQLDSHHLITFHIVRGWRSQLPSSQKLREEIEAKRDSWGQRAQSHILCKSPSHSSANLTPGLHVFSGVQIRAEQKTAVGRLKERSRECSHCPLQQRTEFGV